MAAFVVRVTIENKPGISDPEGETILNDLIVKGGATNVSKIRTAKMLKFTITEKDKKSAKEEIKKMCDNLRLYNPLVSKIIVNVSAI